MFETEVGYRKFVNSSKYVEPNISLVNSINKVKYNPISNELDFICNKTNDCADVTLNFSGRNPNCAFEISTDGGASWQDCRLGRAFRIDGSTHTKIRGKARNARKWGTDVSNGTYKYYFSIRAEDDVRVTVSGDVTSLINGVGGDIALPDYAFAGLFKQCKPLAIAPNLPSTTLSANCYTEMFYGCVLLKDSPILPAEILVEACYVSMFEGCENLTTITALFDHHQQLSFANYLARWTKKIPDTGTFYKNPSASLSNSDIELERNWRIRDYAG